MKGIRAAVGTPLRVLILEDSEDDSLLILHELKRGGFEPDHLRVETREDMADALDAGGWDIIISDYLMPRFNALEALRLMQDKGIDLPFIIVSGSIGEETAVEAMQAGARDYLMKGNLTRLAAAVARELEQVRVRRAHRQSEESLRESELKLRRITDNMLDMVGQTDVAGVFQYISPSCERVLGYLPEELLGHYIFEFLHPDDAQSVLESFIAAQESLEPDMVEYRYRHKDGHYIWLETLGNPLFDEAGKPIGAIFGTREVTERRLTLDRLVRLNGLFLEMGADPLEDIRKLLEAGRELLGGKLMKYCRSNTGDRSVCYLAPAEEAFRIEEKAPCLSFYRNLFVWEKPLILGGEDIRGAATADPDLAAYELRSGMGSPVWRENEIVGYLVLFETRLREFSLAELELLGMLVRAIGIAEERWTHEENLRGFIDVASHELRHPITIMKGYAETMGAMGERMNDALWEEGLRAIDRGADRLETLVAELLETSRIERERFIMVKRDCHLDDLVAQALVEMNRRKLDNPFSLQVIGESVPVWADPDRLVQLLINLLDNAVKYSPPASGIEIEIETGEVLAVVSMADRGLGVPEEDRERIFDRFYQVEDVMHHSTPGIGLGLYIGRKIVDAHAGKIWCEPREGGGSVFRFSIPVAFRDQERGGADEG